MDCRDIEILIQMDIDHCLPEVLRPELDAHLAACPECAALAVELHRLDEMLAAEITHVEVPSGFTAAVMAALPSGAPRHVVKKRRPRFAAWGISGVAVAAALLLTVGLSGWFDGLFGKDPLLSAPVIAALDEADLPGSEVVKPQQPEAPVIPPGTDEEEPPADGQPEDEPQEIIDDEPVDVEPPTYSEAIDLPRVATNTIATGEYAVITLAYCETCDAKLPRVSGSTVTYYMEDNGQKLEYQVPVDGSSEPQLVGKCESLPSPLGHGKKQSETVVIPAEAEGEEATELTIEYYQAVSPDGLTTAINRTDGFYLQRDADAEAAPQRVAETGGGSLVSWSPDGNKVLFSDAAGTLYLYYPAEGTTLTLSHSVYSVCWSGNQHLVFAAHDATTGYASIFRATVP